MISGPLQSNFLLNGLYPISAHACIPAEMLASISNRSIKLLGISDALIFPSLLGSLKSKLTLPVIFPPANALATPAFTPPSILTLDNSSISDISAPVPSAFWRSLT